MGWRTGSAAAAVAVALVSTMATPTQAAGAGTAGAAEGTAAATKPAAGTAAAGPLVGGKAGPAHQTVTLLTGDRVTLRRDAAGRQSAQVVPGPGRTGMPFLQKRERGRVQIVPADAAKLLATGRLDPALFDVAGLLEQGFSDATSRDLPLIVRYAGAAAGTARGQVAAAGAQRGRALPTLGADAVRTPKREATRFWASLTGGTGTVRRGLTVRALRAGLHQVWLDRRLRVSLDQSVPQVGAPQAWRAGFTGRGVKVAILDTGYDPTHPDLKGRVSQARDFTTAPAVQAAEPVDRNGHGTHVASTVAGSGAAAAGRYKGVAPDADLLVGKVCNDEGSCEFSHIVAGMEWAATAGAKVVNMSLGGRDDPGVDPLEEAVGTLTAKHGTLFVIAAGNAGPERESVGSPASADAALAVAAVTKRDGLAVFSSVGPRTGDAAMKPEVTAPGVDIVAARAAGTLDDVAVGPQYARLSGTSMATPHVAGAAALLAQQHPGWTPGQLKSALVGSAAGLAGLTAFQQGSGRLDLRAAVARPVLATPAAASFGKLSTDAGGAARRTVTYHNSGAAPVTLDLKLAVTGEDGKPLPDSAFGLSAPRVVVPAGGDAAVEVSAEVAAGPRAYFGGWLTATAADGSTVVRTAVGGARKPPEFEQTFVVTDRQGRPGFGIFVLVNLETGEGGFVFADSGRFTLSLPRGPYGLLGWTYTELDESHADATSFAEGRLVLDRPRETVLDARRGEPVELTVDRRGAEQVGSSIMAKVGPPGQEWSSLVSAEKGSETPHLFAVRTEHPGDGLGGAVSGTLARPDGKGLFANSPYVHHLTYPFAKALPKPAFSAVERDLATVAARYAAPAPADTGQVGAASFDESFATLLPSWTPSVPVAFPRQRTEFYSPGVPWARYIDQGTFEEPIFQSAPVTKFERGRRYQERWNDAVFGPGPLTGGTRFGNDIGLNADLFSASAPAISGEDWSSAASATLFANGRSLGKQNWPNGGFWEGVPAGRAAYKLVAEATRKPVGPARLSRQVRAVWTFTSAPSTEEGVDLRLPVLRFAPALDPDNRAPAGQPLGVPVYAQVSGVDAAAAVKSLGMDVSYDDGRTWTRAPLVRKGTRWFALLRHPKRTGGEQFVALRAKASTTAGVTVEESITRAYRLK